MSKTSIGIDIGLNSVKMVELTKDHGGAISLTKAAVRYASFGWDATEGKRAQAITALIKKVREARRWGHNKAVVISHPSLSVFIRYIDVLTMKNKKESDVIALEAGEQIPLPLEEVSWDYAITEEEKGVGKKAVILAVKKESIDESVDIVKKAGFLPQSMTLNLLCLYNLSRSKKSFAKYQGLIIVDIGAEVSGILIGRGKHIWLRNVSIGGKKITESMDF